MQKSNAQLPINPSKKPYSQSFATDRSSSVLNQFILKTKQVLIDDLKTRKVYQSVRLIHHSYKSELKQFMKHFVSKPKDQFIELCNHLIQKYVDHINLKIYLWYFREGKEIRNQEDTSPFRGLLDSFSYSILSQQSQKDCTKSLQTQETRSKKPSVVHTESLQTFEDIFMSPPQQKLRKQESMPDQIEVGIFEGTKEAKDILKPLEKLLESLSKGDLQEAMKQKFPVSVVSKLKEKREKFIQRCQVIKRAIEYLNNAIPSSQRVKPEMSLKSLQKCMDKVNKMGNKSKKGQKQKAMGSINTPQKGQAINNDQKSIQSLEKGLSQAQKLFNDKSIEWTKERMKLMNQTNEMNLKLNRLNEENFDLKDEISVLKERLQQKQKQIQNIREDFFQKLKQKSLQYEISVKEEVKKQLLKKTQIIDDLKNQLQESSKSSSLKQKSENQNVKKLNRLVQTLKSENEQLKLSLNELQKKISQLKQQNLQLSEKINQKQSSISTLTAKISSFQQKQTALKKQNKQLEDKMAKLNLSLNDQSLKLQSQSKHYEKILSKTLEYIQLNSLLESSQILPPFPLATLTESLFNNSSFLSQESYSKRQQILHQKRLSAIVQKQFLVRQIQRYVGKIQSFSKVKAFKLIYRHNPDLKSNFHEHIDDKPCFLLLVKLRSGAIVGGYSHQPLKKGLRTQLGFIFSLSLLQPFYLKDKHCLVYDEYYLIFGNSQIRIRIGQNIFYSNFGITKANFQVHDRNFTDFLMVQNEREQLMEYFQVYQVSFDRH